MVVEIPLTQGYVALVDDDDADVVRAFTWHARRRGHRVIVATSWGVGRRPMFLSRFLLNPPAELQVDHINRNPLDNRRSNLRLATNSQNQANKPGTVGRFKGVFWHEKTQRWHAHITHNKKRRHIGSFTEEEAAARAYDALALELFGEFAFLNLPEEDRS